MKPGRFLRLLVSLLLLGWLVRRFGLPDFRPGSFHPGWLAAILVINLVLIPLASGFRWRAFLKAAGMRVSLHELIRINFVSIFWGMMLPSADGFALIRGAIIERSAGAERGKAAASLVAEKAVGMITLGLIAFLASLTLASSELSARLRTAILAYLALVVAAMLLLTLLPTRYQAPAARWKVWLSTAGIALRSGLRLRAILPALPWVLAVQAAAILNVHVLFLMLGKSLPLAVHFCYVPVIMVITLLPVTLGGFGLRESAFVLFYRGLCGDTGIPVTVSLLQFATLSLIPALVGAVLSLGSKDPFRRRTGDPQ